MSYEVNGVPVETGGTADRLLPWDRVRDIVGISRATAWRMQKTGDFPDPVPISPNRVGWWESELTAWKATRKAEGRSRPRPFAPPRAPKLIETARSPRPRPAPATPTEEPSAGAVSPAGPSVQPQLAFETAVPSAAAPTAASRRKHRVSPDQIDFGF